MRYRRIEKWEVGIPVYSKSIDLNSLNKKSRFNKKVVDKVSIPSEELCEDEITHWPLNSLHLEYEKQEEQFGDCRPKRKDSTCEKNKNKKKQPVNSASLLESVKHHNRIVRAKHYHVLLQQSKTLRHSLLTARRS